MHRETGTLILIRLFFFTYRPDICGSVPNLQVCKDLTPNDYEIHQPPDHGGKPTKIFTWFQILDFGDINQANMDYLLHAFVIHIWNDSRLLVDQYRGRDRPTFLHHNCRDYIWKPYIFYETIKDATSDLPDLPASEFKILPDGAVFISTKFLFRAFCPMHLKHFPFDTQTCVFKISLLTFNLLTQLQWIGGPESPYQHEKTSIEMLNEPRLLLFHFTKPINDSIVEVYTGGNYSTLLIKFSITRRLTGSIINVYIPSTMIVVMSWACFWLGLEQVPARVALSVTSLLTLCTQVHQYRTELPPANYLKAMDIWMFVCILIVFSTLVEFAFGYNSRQKQLTKRNTEMNSPNDIKRLGGEKVVKVGFCATNSSKCKAGRRIPGTFFGKSTIQDKRISKKDRIYVSNKTDETCRVLYPTLFVIFAVIYWIYYLNIYGKTINLLTLTC